MRARRAREADLSPFRIISDEALLALAKKMPAGSSDLNGVRGLTPLVRRRIGSDVLESVRAGLLGTEADLPAPPRGRPRKKTSAMQNRLDRLRERRQTAPAAPGLHPGLL